MFAGVAWGDSDLVEDGAKRDRDERSEDWFCEGVECTGEGRDIGRGRAPPGLNSPASWAGDDCAVEEDSSFWAVPADEEARSCSLSEPSRCDAAPSGWVTVETLWLEAMESRSWRGGGGGGGVEPTGFLFGAGERRVGKWPSPGLIIGLSNGGEDLGDSFKARPAAASASAGCCAGVVGWEFSGC